MDGYVPVWVKSNFSFLQGASHPEELVEQAHNFGLPAIAIADRDGVYGIVEAHVRARELGIGLLVGAEVTVGEHGDDQSPDKSVVLLAENREGYANLCRAISIGRLRSQKGRSMLKLEEVCNASRGLLALCPEPELLPVLWEGFGDRLYAMIGRHLRAEEQPRERAVRLQAQGLGVPTVGTCEILYHTAARQCLHDVMSCIRHGTRLTNAGTCIRPNAEHHIKTVQSMRQMFEDDLVSLNRSLEIAERCDFSLSQLRYRYPAERRPDGKSESDWLHQITMEGAHERYGRKIPEQVRDQIQRELCLIQELDYGGYFLTMWEIVRFCRRENILCQGRGSAANSAVCYCLGITAIDPVKLDLLFERFLSRERAEPPDIDLDIEHHRREEVIQFVYRRYGRRHAAMVANIIRYRTRSAVREVGKALGMPTMVVDKLSKLLGSRFADFDQRLLEHAGLDAHNASSQHLLRLVQEIREFPRHLSIHPGGFLLGHEPVDTIVPIEPATMADRTVIQWDKTSVEDLGLFKVDLLGLGALTQVHQCFDLMRQHQGVDMDFASVPPEDPATYEMISRGDTVGVFQIESRAQMSMLPRLKPKTFYDLVIEVAIVRPGPIQGNMVHPYLKRRNHREKIVYPHASLERILAKTLGVPIFQEQVMKIAVKAGGYTPGEADQLRRDMAAWRSSGRIERHRDRLVSRMVANGIDQEFAERIFSQIRGFGEYGFPESHAASFALIVYVTAWLRRHHLAAFTCSLLNAQPMGFYSPATIIQDARRHGLEVRPIDVQHSRWDCTLEPVLHGGSGQDQGLRSHAGTTHAVRMGLRYVKGMGVRDRDALERNWVGCGDFCGLEDFVRRTGLCSKSLLSLAEAGAFQSFGIDRRDAVWALREILSRVDDALRFTASQDETSEAGGGSLQQQMFPSLSPPEEVFWDYRASRHSTRGHPMMNVRHQLQEHGIPSARVLNAMPNGKPTDYVGMVICRQQPGTASRVTFYTLEDETGFVNLVVWFDVFERYSVLARTALLIGVTGKLQSESGVIHLIADRLWDPAQRFGPVP